jgi:hypothetical protein
LNHLDIFVVAENFRPVSRSCEFSVSRRISSRRTHPTAAVRVNHVVESVDQNVNTSRRNTIGFNCILGSNRSVSKCSRSKSVSAINVPACTTGSTGTGINSCRIIYDNVATKESSEFRTLLRNASVDLRSSKRPETLRSAFARA